MSEVQLQSAAALLESEVKNGSLTASSILVARRGTVVLNRAFGHLSPRRDSSPVSPESIFLLASITKPVTACALMLLVERGKVSLLDPVSHYIPEFAEGERSKI